MSNSTPSHAISSICLVPSCAMLPNGTSTFDCVGLSFSRIKRYVKLEPKTFHLNEVLDPTSTTRKPFHRSPNLPPFDQFRDLLLSATLLSFVFTNKKHALNIPSNSLTHSPSKMHFTLLTQLHVSL
ncbi:hypothetical protein QVD17_19221 [Tagetes erecta]|uniref:Uncharacterized protein n=1 Tax=Tagetes erecta TaxID=13708 RepID=A0AAD8KQK7_TARER|nr:hypothetical protein QVD17_19221 [Tagetes erecta]